MSAKKLILLVLGIFLAFTACDIVNWYASPDAVSWSQDGNVRALESGSVAKTAGLEPFRSVLYELEAPLEGSADAFLTCFSEEYMPAAAFRQSLPKGTVRFAFNFPLASYAELDCLLKAETGIAKTTVSDQPAVRRQGRYPVRPLNILVPAVLLSAVLLLFVRVEPLNRFLKTADRNFLDPETRYTGVTVAYIVFALAMLLHHVYVILYFQQVKTGADGLSIPLLVFAAVTFLLGRLWKDRVSWILLALLVLKYARTAFSGQVALDETSHVYIMAIYAFFGAYGVGRALPEKNRKAFFSGFCAFWTVCVLVYAAFGIYAAAAGTPVKNLGNEWFRIRDDGRMCFTNHPVTSGITLATAMAVLLIGFTLAKSRILKALCVVSAAVLFVAGSITGTRTVYLLSGIELALLFVLLAYDRLKPDLCEKKAVAAGKWLAVAAVFLAAIAAVAFIQSYTCEAFSLIRTKGGLLIPQARAEAVQPEMYDITRRGFLLSDNPDDTFAGRLTVWSNLLEVLKSNPRNLLIGQSVCNPIKVVNDIRVPQGLYVIYHCHNTFLQILLENGVPGFLLYLGFAFVFAFHAVRVFRNRNLPFWQRLIPLPAVACFVADLVDSTCHVTFGYPQMTLLFLFAGFTIAISRQAKKESASLRR